MPVTPNELQDDFDIVLEVTLREVDEDPHGIMRWLMVEIWAYDDVQNVKIGVLDGWLAHRIWHIDPEVIWDSTDAISSDAEVLGTAVREILTERDLLTVEDLILVNRVTLEKRFRGRKLLGRIIDHLIFVQRYNEGEVLTVTMPEPLALDGSGHVTNWFQREEGMEKLHAACREAGMKPWKDGRVWWLQGEPNVPESKRK